MAPKRETALELWGYELARAREAAGMSGRKLADALYMVPSTVSQWETGKRTPHLKDVERVEEVLGTNGYLKRFLVKWVPREVSPQWLEWIGIEENADTLLSFEHSVIPGLLQAEDYARGVLSHDRYSPIDLDERLRSRLERQRILDDGNPPTAVFIIGEAALHHQVGSRETMHAQLMHLVTLAERPEVIIQVVPGDAGFHEGLAGAFTIARVKGREVVLQDGIWRGQILEGEAEVSALAKAWQHVLAKALSAEASKELIERVAKSWTA
jgi:transcriptional regulator with XRE-family HTH domain